MSEIKKQIDLPAAEMVTAQLRVGKMDSQNDSSREQTATLQAFGLRSAAARYAADAERADDLAFEERADLLRSATGRSMPCAI